MMNQGAIDFNTHNHVPHTPTNVLVFLIEILRVTLIALAAVVPTKVLVYLNNATGTTSRPMTTTTQLFRHVGITRALKTAIRNLRNREDQTQRDFFYEHENRVNNRGGIYTSQTQSDRDIKELANMANVARVALGFTSDTKGHFVGNFSATFTIGGVQYNQNFMAPTWVRAGYTTEDMWIRHHFGMMDINFWANVAAAITWIILVEDMGTYLIIKDIAMARNKPWVVIYMGGQADRATRALMHEMHSRFNCNVGVIIDCDKGGLDELKSLMIPGESCPDAEKVFKVNLVKWIGPLPSTILSNGFNRGQLSAEECTLVRDNIRDNPEFFPTGCDEPRRRSELNLMINHRIQANTAYVRRAFWNANIDNMLTNAV